MALPIAVQLYSVRKDLAADFRGTLEKVKALGYDGVEFAGLNGYSAAEIKAMCEEIGLCPISAHVPHHEMKEDAEGVLRTYAEIGCKYVAFPYLTPEYRPGCEKFAEFLEDMKVFGKVARDLGMTLLYHNHDFEFVELDGKYALDVLYEEVPADLLQTELDTCWVKVAGVEPTEYIKQYSGRCPVVHLKDFEGEKSSNMYALIGIKSDESKKPSTFEYRPVGSGKQDFPAIIKASEEAGAEWLVVEQDSPSMGLTPMECIEKSRDYLRTIYA